MARDPAAEIFGTPLKPRVASVFLELKGSTISISEAAAKLRLEAKQIKGEIRRLEDLGLIDRADKGQPKGRGRPEIRYKRVSHQLWAIFRAAKFLVEEALTT